VEAGAAEEVVLVVGQVGIKHHLVLLVQTLLLCQNLLLPQQLLEL
jgi:hypothetical protein